MWGALHPHPSVQILSVKCNRNIKFSFSILAFESFSFCGEVVFSPPRDFFFRCKIAEFSPFVSLIVLVRIVCLNMSSFRPRKFISVWRIRKNFQFYFFLLNMSCAACVSVVSVSMCRLTLSLVVTNFCWWCLCRNLIFLGRS